MLTQLEDPRIRQILSLDGDDRAWRDDLERLRRGDASLTRHSAGEDGIKAVQRLLIFLGYSTATTGAFLIDGDFGRGTNRGIAQFQFEHGLPTRVTRDELCYECNFHNAHKKITAIPDTRLDVATLDAMLTATVDAMDAKRITFGQFDDALFHLNALHRGQHLDCKGILERYGAAADKAVDTLKREAGVDIGKEWILSIIRQETAGVVRPRFEQHKLYQAHRKSPGTPLDALRIQSMSIGLGQIMGFNYAQVGAPSPQAMLWSPIEDQVLYVARFISTKRSTVAKRDPTIDDFRTLARYYNGPAYESHFYHEKLQRWFREFRALLG